MAARDILAAVLIAAGTTALSLAAFLISAPMGFAALGLMLVALGVAIGIGEFGEREGHQGPPATEETAFPTVTPTFPVELPADVAGVTETADLQSLVPLANYLGRTGHAAPVAVPSLRPQP